MQESKNNKDKKEKTRKSKKKQEKTRTHITWHRQLQNPGFDPLPSMLEALPGQLVLAAKKGAANTARHPAIEPGLVLRFQMAAG